MLDQAITFGPYRLDPGTGLARGKRRVHLTPRAFSLLCMLAGEHGRVVAKEEIFRTVWRGTAVGDAALATCIQELRRALGDKAGQPRYIETLHRRGYRFIPPTPEPAPPAAELPGSGGPGAEIVVGRGEELAHLQQALASARNGTRKVVLVAGEAGIGKTALLRAFLSRAGEAAPLRLAWGQSAEHYGPSEPYHPLLDAIGRACRAPWGETFVRRLHEQAPLWMAQLPGLVSQSGLRALQRRCAGATPERMQRELTEALEAVAADQPLALWLEDLHWADPPTLDWLAAFARRPERVRLLVLGTFRPEEARGARHGLHALEDELARHGQTRTICLAPLTKQAVSDYVLTRFAPDAGQEKALGRLAGEVHGRTEGSPLFMVGVLNELVRRGLFERRGAAWSLSGDAGAARLGIPDYLREMIDRHIDRVGPAAMRVLEAACIAGLQFSSALVAAAVGRPVADVERACVELVRDYSLLAYAGAEEWPDGSVSSRFAFAHALYREALAARLPAALGAELHLRVAERLGRAYGGRPEEVAGQLALHFERGRDLSAAAQWLRKAGDAAMRRNALREAAGHYEHALRLLDGMATPDPDAAKAALYLALCAPLIGLHGMGSPRVEACARQALDSCAALGDAGGRFAALRTLWNNSLMRYPVAATLAHARALMEQAGASGRPVELALAHRALGSTLIYVGDYAEAANLLARGAALSDQVPDAQFEVYGEHPGMVCRAFCAWPKAFMGLREEAVRLSDDSVEHARGRNDIHGLAFALVTAGLVDVFHRDVARARAVAREVSVLAKEYRFAQWIAFADEIEGWVAFQRGEHSRGLQLMRQALDQLRATGARTHSSRLLANLAESCLAAGHLAQARCHIDAALAHRAETGEQYYAPELFRLHALILRQEGAPAPKAQDALDEALRIARQQRAALFEQRLQGA